MKPTLPAWRRDQIRKRATSLCTPGMPAALVPGHLVHELLAAYEAELAARGVLDDARDLAERDPQGWILTYTGVRFWPLEPRVEEVKIEDIAHALAQLCRFAGHIVSFYSVAQHSVIVSHACHPDDALAGLLHDATEAYLIDMPSPIKRAPPLAGYRGAERRLELVVAEAFGLPASMPHSVHLADLRALATEKRDLRRHADGLPEAAPPLPQRIRPMMPGEAEAMFLTRFDELQARRKAAEPAAVGRERAAGKDD